MDPGPVTSARDVDISALAPGAKVGRYEVISVLGQGAFGITYRARDTRLDRDVAVKEYLPTLLAYRDAGSTVLPRSTKVAEDFIWGRERFVSEGRTLATLHEAPGIVKVFDFLEANGTAYLVMEMVRGDTLESHLSKRGPLGPQPVERLLWPLLAGLEQVHNAGFLHRDIKPANILIGDSGQPTLIDFGASRAAMAGRTTAMTAVFTPGYAAPEQFTSGKQGPWTDIYGLSATLHHAIAGAPPPSAFDRMMDDSYKPLTESPPPGFSYGLLAGIDSGLIVRARERPQSITAWRPLLGQAGASDMQATVVMRKSAADDATSAEPSSTISIAGLARLFVGRRGRRVRIAIVVLVLAALGSEGGYHFARGPASKPAVTINQGMAVPPPAALAAPAPTKVLPPAVPPAASTVPRSTGPDGIWRGVYGCMATQTLSEINYTFQVILSGGSGTWARPGSGPGTSGDQSISVVVKGALAEISRNYISNKNPGQLISTAIPAVYDGNVQISGGGSEKIDGVTRSCGISLVRVGP